MSRAIHITITPNSTDEWGTLGIGRSEVPLPYSLALSIERLVEQWIREEARREAIPLLERLERDAIASALRNRNGRTTEEIADKLGIHVNTLYRKRKKYAI